MPLEERTRSPWILTGQTWEDVLGKLHAARSRCRVRHAPVDTIATTWWRTAKGFKDSGWHGELGLWLVPITVFLPLDIVLAPGELAYRSIQDLRMTDEEIRQALIPLAEARRLGFSLVSTSHGSGFAPEYYLDKLGHGGAPARP